MENTSSRNNLIENLIVFLMIFTSVTGWYMIDYVGMKFFWAVYFIAAFGIIFSVVKNYRSELNIKTIFGNKYNLVGFIYLLWNTVTYLLNYNGKTTILYIIKMWFLIILFLLLVSVYMKNCSAEDNKKFIYKISCSIFILGIILTLIGLYQYLFNSNKLLFISFTEWPAYNPASLYGNVNGFGTYLFFSIISGLYCLCTYSKKQFKPVIIFIITIMCYMLYFTIARTSIVVTIVFIIFGLFIFKFDKSLKFKNIISKKSIVYFIIANLLMLYIVNSSAIINFITNLNQPPSTEKRKTNEMLEQKNSEGFNNRQFIWEAVMKDYKSYILAGDGLKYNVIKHINIVKVISARSKGDTRISYHNTLFRYYASNGLIGLLLFLLFFLTLPIKLFYSMIKNKEFETSKYLALLYFICIFLYMQMEEVYFGEVMFAPVCTLVMLAYAQTLFKKSIK